MKRKITSAIAAVLVGSMIIGSTVFAADSSTTTNTEAEAVTTSTTEEAPVALLETPEVKEGKTMFAVPNGKGEGTATVDNTRVTVSYNQATLPNIIETIIKAPANEGATRALQDYVANNFPGRNVRLQIKIQMYQAGVSINEAGAIQQSIGVGNAFDGQTATVVQHHKDGTITATDVPVVNGKITFTTPDFGTFFILL